MDDIELAKVRVDRAIKLVDNFENLSENDFKKVLWCLSSALELMPSRSREGAMLYYYLQQLTMLEVKRYGEIFKANGTKTGVLLKKNDLIELAWRVNSLFF